MIPICGTYHKIGWFAGRRVPNSVTLTVVAKGTYALRHGAEAVPCDEQEDLSGDVHVDEDPARVLTYPSDFAPFKPGSDLLLIGRCHAPGGRPADVVPVTFGVGGFSKTLAVIGDRRWLRRAPSPPAPFRALAVSYENAYGGPGYARNPLGKGFGGDQEGRPLPNIEVPGDLIDDPDDEKEPAGFGPVPMAWPQRMSKAGTYDETWIRKRKPAFPADFDWSFFHAAPEDQRLSRYLEGSETLRFENLHPSHPVYESRLPAIRIRCFLGSEIPMLLDTLWVDLDAEKLVLVWRGNSTVPSEELPDDDRLFVVAEPLGSPPKPAEAYVASPTAPAERREEPDAPEPPAPPTHDREWCLKKIRSGRGLRDQDLARADLSDLDLRGIDLRGAILTGARLEKSDLAEADLSDAVLAGANLGGAKLTGTALRNADLTGASLPGADLEGADLEEADFSGADLAGAILRRSRGARAVFAGTDLTRANLSDANLPAACFREAALTECDFRGASLPGASWESARGERITAQGADLTELRASGAHLGGSDFRSVRAARSTWQQADLTDANFERAVLPAAEFERAVLRRAGLSRADLRGARLVRCDLSSVRARAADLFRAGLEGAVLRAADFTGANLFESDLQDAETDGARWEGANLKRTVLHDVSR